MKHNLKDFGIEGIYVVHAKTGYEVHEERINRLFPEMGMEHEFVTDGDISNFTPELLGKYFCPEISSNLSQGALSCTLNHILSYEKIVKNQNRYALIFENDPFFLGDFPCSIASLAREAEELEPGFIISLENSTLRFPPYKTIKKDKLIYEADNGRCAGAYLIDFLAAETILKDLKANKCTQVIDWWHNSMIDRNIIKVYWAHPTLTEQGSHNGLMSSPLSTSKKNMARRIKWVAQKLYKTHFLRYLK